MEGTERYCYCDGPILNVQETRKILRSTCAKPSIPSQKAKEHHRRQDGKKDRCIPPRRMTAPARRLAGEFWLAVDNCLHSAIFRTVCPTTSTIFETRLPFLLHDGDVTEGNNLIRRVQKIQPTKTPE